MESKRDWISKGYQQFAIHGPHILKVETLSKVIGKSKSSFYNLFPDINHFIGDLLIHHELQAKIIAEKERNSTKIDPEIIEIILDHKTDFLFSRQLRVLRSIDRYRTCYEKVNTIVGDAFLHVWIQEIGMEGRELTAQKLYEFSLDNFYLQITEQNLQSNWLRNYFHELKKMIINLM